MKNICSKNLADVQSMQPETPIQIDCTGVRGLKRHILLRDKTNGEQLTVATVDLGVDLAPALKGTHMSRLVQTLNIWNEKLDYQSLAKLLGDLKERLQARRAWAAFKFTYLIKKHAPTGSGAGIMGYECSITSELSESGQTFLLGLEVPVMTVCPCSKAISEEGAHSQRALIKMRIRIVNFVWLEDFIELAEQSASSAVYPFLKRPDEKFVTENAFARPVFVEDVARTVAANLARHPDILWYDVDVESMESIHNHNAFARICSNKEGKSP